MAALMIMKLDRETGIGQLARKSDEQDDTAVTTTASEVEDAA